MRRYQHSVRPYAGRVYAALAFVAALIAAATTIGQWDNWLLFTHATSFGYTDPVFGLNAGFFVFRLPFLQFMVDWVLASLVVEEPFDRLEMEARMRTLVLLRELLQDVPRIVLFSRGEVVDARPELFDAILELRDDALGGMPLRPAPAGDGRSLPREPVPRPAGRRVSRA